MGLAYKANWQDGAKRGAAKNKFMAHLKKCVEECNIRLSDPTSLDVVIDNKMDKFFPSGETES